MNVTERVRRQSWHYLNPDVGAVAGLSVQDLQLFLSGTRTLSSDQIQKLARRIKVSEK
jgi:hypothetical protein